MGDDRGAVVELLRATRVPEHYAAQRGVGVPEGKVFFLALLPIGLATAALPDALLWRISSAVMATFIVAFSAIMLHLRRQYLERALWLGPALASTISITTMVNLFAQTLNSSGFLFEPNATCAFFGIVWFLLFACLMLVRIVFLPPGSQENR